MLFTQTEFFALLAVTFAFLLAVGGNRPRKLFLLAVSYYFYAYWDWRFLGLLLLSTTVDFSVGHALNHETRVGRRRTLLALSLATDLGLLGLFKYCNFFIESLTVMLSPLGLHVGTFELILPLGISFYTFRTLSYVIDVYRHRLSPCTDYCDYALFVGFFPTLLAGPIVRASCLLPQFESPRALSWDRALDGFRQFVLGMFKKVFIADNVAVFVDGVFDNPGVFDGGTTWLAVAAYGAQIYCDFSGYSDMAIGTARAIGYDLPENFDYPYLSTSVAEFWRRWHVSLSTWFRDYVFLPLAYPTARLFARATSSQRWADVWAYATTTMAVMFLVGLWHGAAWAFVVWGLLHGAALVLQRWGTRPRRRRCAALPPWLRDTVGWSATMAVVMVAWVFFRAHGLASSLTLLRRMFLEFAGVTWIHPFALLAISLTALDHLTHLRTALRWQSWPVGSFRAATVTCLMLWLTILFRPTGFVPFVYAQF